MTTITFTTTSPADVYASRISDGVVNYWTTAPAATVGQLQDIADAFLSDYDGEGQIDFEIYDGISDLLLAACVGKPDQAAQCWFED